MKLMIDLFSGLGGASEAMVEDDSWSVLRYDNNPLLGGVPLTTICDLMTTEIGEDLPGEGPDHAKTRAGVPTIIWASPPCLAFSTAYHAPKSIAQRAGEEYCADMSLVNRAYGIIQELKPKWWVIENVAGASKDFEELLGPPRQIIGPFLMWGRFPLIPMSRDFQHLKSNNDARHSELRANVRAKIPWEISQGLLDTVNNQRSISDY